MWSHNSSALNTGVPEPSTLQAFVPTLTWDELDHLRDHLFPLLECSFWSAKVQLVLVIRCDWLSQKSLQLRFSNWFFSSVLEYVHHILRKDPIEESLEKNDCSQLAESAQRLEGWHTAAMWSLSSGGAGYSLRVNSLRIKVLMTVREWSRETVFLETNCCSLPSKSHVWPSLVLQLLVSNIYSFILLFNTRLLNVQYVARQWARAWNLQTCRERQAKGKLVEIQESTVMVKIRMLS